MFFVPLASRLKPQPARLSTVPNVARSVGVSRRQCSMSTNASANWNAPKDAFSLVSFDNNGTLHWAETLPPTLTPVSKYAVAVRYFLACTSVTEAFLSVQGAEPAEEEAPPKLCDDNQPIAVVCTDGTVVTAVSVSDAPSIQWIALIAPASTPFQEHIPIRDFLPVLRTAATYLMPSPPANCKSPLQCLFFAIAANLVGDHGWGARNRAPREFQNAVRALSTQLAHAPVDEKLPYEQSLLFNSPILRNWVTSFIATVKFISSEPLCKFCIFTPQSHVAFGHNLTSHAKAYFRWYFNHILYTGDRTRRNEYSQRTSCGLTYFWYCHQRWVLFAQTITAENPTPHALALLGKNARNILLEISGKNPDPS